MRFHRWLLLMLLWPGSPGAEPGMQVVPGSALVQVLDRLRANLPPVLSVEALRIETELPDGTQLIEARLLTGSERGQARAFLELRQPESLRGIRYLLRAADPPQETEALYLFLPALQRTRRLRSEDDDAVLADSAVRLSDLHLLRRALVSSSITLEGREVIAGRETDRLRFSPASGEIRRLRLWVDRQTAVLLRAEQEDQAGVARRYQADVGSLRHSGDYWFASRGEFQDQRRQRRSTVLLREVSVTAQPARGLFDPERFAKAR